jgi:hypothetical protein
MDTVGPEAWWILSRQILVFFGRACTFASLVLRLKLFGYCHSIEIGMIRDNLSLPQAEYWKIPSM